MPDAAPVKLFSLEIPGPAGPLDEFESVTGDALAQWLSV